MKGLGHAHAGANPEVQLSLVQDSRTDPEYFALNLTVRTFRKHCVPDSAFPVLDMLSATSPLHLAPGPAGVLLTRLQTIGWQWDGGGWLLDQEMLPIHLLNAPVQELGSRMQRAWQKEVGCRLAKRKTFKGMSKCCIRTSRQGWDRLTPLQKSLMRVVYNGSFYTQDKHAKTGFAETPACRWCGEEDSVLHRVWQCPATEHLRAEIPLELRKEIEKEPECTQHHAWFCEPEQAALFRKALQGIRPYQTVQWVSPDLPETLHLFTDGSCLAPSDSRTRIASWALVLALPAQDNFWPLAYGLVPGQHQTGGRGELIAAIQAFRFAEEHQKSFCLWTDYDRVVRLLETWEWQDEVPTAWKHDHDLQQELYVRYKRARRQGRFLKVVHVTSHLNPCNLTTFVEQWAQQGNAAADLWATQACKEMPEELRLTRNAARDAFERLDWMQEHFRSLHLKIATFAIGTQGKQDNGAPRDLKRQPAEEALRIPFAFPKLREARESDLQQLEPVEDQHMLRWLNSLTCENSQGYWLTWHQLLVDYQLQTGSVGPWQDPRTKRWKPGEMWGMSLQDYSLQLHARALGRYVSWHAKAINDEWKTTFRQPDSAIYAQWATCLKVPMGLERWRKVETFLMQHAQRSRTLSQTFRETPSAAGWSSPEQSQALGAHEDRRMRRPKTAHRRDG